MNNKNILITGGTGLIGIPLVNKLLNRGANITVVSLDSEERAANVLPEGVKFLRRDLTEMNNCKEIVKNQDYVFHLAGIKGSVSLGRSKAASWFVPLILFNTNMMEAAHKAGVKKYLYTSSVGVYPEANIFREDDAWNGPPFSVDVFPGWAKRIGELQAQAYEIEYGWNNISIVRPANVYGPYDNFDPETAMVIGALINKFANHKEGKINIWGNGEQIRDFIFSEDAAEGMIAVLEEGYNKPVNLGSGVGVSIKDIVIELAKIFNYDLDMIEFDTSKPSGESIRLMDVSRIEQECGFKTKTDIKTGLQKTVDWYLTNKELAENRYNVFKQVKTCSKHVCKCSYGTKLNLTDLDKLDTTDGL